MTKEKADALLELVKEWITLGNQGAVSSLDLIMILWAMLDTERDQEIQEAEEMLFKAGYFDRF